MRSFTTINIYRSDQPIEIPFLVKQALLPHHHLES